MPPSLISKCWHNGKSLGLEHIVLLQSQASDTELSFTERAMLLGIAVKWFSSLPADQQQKAPDELKELHKKRWLFKIRAEIEKDFEVRV